MSEHIGKIPTKPLFAKGVVEVIRVVKRSK